MLTLQTFNAITFSSSGINRKKFPSNPRPTVYGNTVLAIGTVSLSRLKPEIHVHAGRPPCSRWQLMLDVRLSVKPEHGVYT